MIVKSSKTEWLVLSDSWYNTASNNVDSLYEVVAAAENAVDEVNFQGDIGSLECTVTSNHIERHNEKRRRLVSFCNAIHYEISEMVDNPFCLKMSETAQQSYDLNPSDIKVNTKSFLGISLKSTLIKLLYTTYLDDKLKEDFEKQFKALDKDVPSSTLKDAIKEANFWKKEFEKSAACQKIAEDVFTDEVRSAWNAMSENERKEILEEYANRIGRELHGERTWWDKFWGNNPSVVKKVGYNASGFGVSHENGKIEINDDFVLDPKKNYSVDKVIDTLTHEIRHEYQAEVKRNPKKYGVPDSLLNEWKQPYIPSSPNYSAYYQQPVEEDAKAFAALSRPE